MMPGQGEDEMSQPATDPRRSGSPIEASYSDDGRLYICFEDATGIITGEGGTQGPDEPYPAMVSWEMDAGTMLPDDARELGLALIRLAEDAERLNASTDAGRS